MTFQYLALNRQRAEIRLLQLKASTDESSPIVCELKHASLNEGIQYEALSYTWGDNTRTHSISLSGIPFPVTSSLFAALRALRSEQSDRCLWIDAVCINQGDIRERNQEILRMLDIYRQATRVVVWLGKAGPDSKLAIEHLMKLKDDWDLLQDHRLIVRAGRISSLILECATAGVSTIFVNVQSRAYVVAAVVACLAFWGPALSGFTYLLSRSIVWWAYLVLGLRSFRVYREASRQIVDKALIPEARLVAALAGVFSRPWFRRVWIVQEMAAAQHAILMCGTDIIMWRDVCRACDQIERLAALSSTRSPYMDSQYSRSKVFRLAFDPNKPSVERTNLKWDLLFLLAHFSSFGALDPHDKVYGLLGLARDIQQQDDEGIMMIPDYNKSLARVYAETVMFVVKRSGCLDILRACEGFHRMPGLPSWAPDWTCNVPRTIDPTPSQSKPYGLPSDPSPEEPVARFADVPLTMTVRGFVIGHLAGSGRILFKLPDPNLSENLRASTYGILDFLFEYIFPYFQFLLWTGVLQFCFKTPIRILMRIYPQAKEQFEPYFGMIDDIFSVSTDKSDSEKDSSGYPMPRRIENIFDAFLDPSADEVALRSVDWTPVLKKATMNPGHCHTYTRDPQERDLVCMFIGAGEAYIVRQVGDHYRLLNSAVFGPFTPYLWSDCEREHREGTLPLQHFRLR